MQAASFEPDNPCSFLVQDEPDDWGLPFNDLMMDSFPSESFFEKGESMLEIENDWISQSSAPSGSQHKWVHYSPNDIMKIESDSIG
jgi:hypothetical protein